MTTYNREFKITIKAEFVFIFIVSRQLIQGFLNLSNMHKQLCQRVLLGFIVMGIIWIKI